MNIVNSNSAGGTAACCFSDRRGVGVEGAHKSQQQRTHLADLNGVVVEGARSVAQQVRDGGLHQRVRAHEPRGHRDQPAPHLYSNNVRVQYSRFVSDPINLE